MSDPWQDLCRSVYDREEPGTFDKLQSEYQEKLERAEARVESGELSQRDCDLCGEPLGEEIGEFYDPKRKDMESIIACAQCGIEHGLELA